MNIQPSSQLLVVQCSAVNSADAQLLHSKLMWSSRLEEKPSSYKWNNTIFLPWFWKFKIPHFEKPLNRQSTECISQYLTHTLGVCVPVHWRSLRLNSRAGMISSDAALFGGGGGAEGVQHVPTVWQWHHTHTHTHLVAVFVVRPLFCHFDNFMAN